MGGMFVGVSDLILYVARALCCFCARVARAKARCNMFFCNLYDIKIPFTYFRVGG